MDWEWNQWQWGKWHDGNAFDARVGTDGRDTYPNDFRCMVEVRDRATGKVTRHRGTGKYIGNFSPIWIKWPGMRKRIQLTELLRMDQSSPDSHECVECKTKFSGEKNTEAFCPSCGGRSKSLNLMATSSRWGKWSREFAKAASMTREMALPYVSYVVDDALSGRGLGDDPTAKVTDKSRLVGWQCGFEPLFVAVNSYLDTRLDEEEAAELATDYLNEIGWFGSSGRREPDYIL